MKKIGFIGLGIMGKPMSKNLLKAGYELIVLSTSKSSGELAAAGAALADTPKAVAEQADLIITMLPDSPQVKEVILGKDGVIEGAKAGSIVIDMSSIAPLASQEVARTLAEKGVRMLDAPVSGGEPKAIAGTLSVMVGGEQDIFEQCRDVLLAMASSVVRTGGIGAGNVTKLANQIIVGINLAAMSEAMVLAAKAGVEPELVYEAIRGGLAGSAVLDAKVPLVLDRRFEPGFRIELHKKDLGNVLATSQQYDIPLPLTSTVLEMMRKLEEDGLGASDHGGLIRYYEQLARVEVSR
ncbi:2-hydroxy-3-oxopropionate reductase [Paenibacillus sp. N4]|uniref:2-hydroxy-3-oxopropionate reductase n=1 Tax=Paenibacillus vietnamensis TaxID=2590547 RepID=UPI001CD155CC|nr:2-hydroxy-3-oxopropionate reductase [Paenibacillus vietnamensis]MCA0756886.1 2-hydroxy-3-oxopropionate reductase [Paenibacillus vietnamensis]